MEASTARSRLFGGLYLVLIIIVLGAVIPSAWSKPKVEKKPFKRIDFSRSSIAPGKVKDTNGDGVISWNEAVSASLADSTGTLDIIKDNPIDQKSIAELNDPNNLTGSFSKNLFLATTQLRESGATDDATKQKTISYLMEQEASKINHSPYALKDLRVDASETKASVRAYGNVVAPLVTGILSKESITADLTGLATYSQSQDDSDLSAITKNKNRVNVILQKLLAVKVPPSAASYHLLAVNRIAFYRDTLASFETIGSDPVRATLMFNSYQDTLLLLARIPPRFSEYFSSQNVVFGGSEAGYIFTTGQP